MKTKRPFLPVLLFAMLVCGVSTAAHAVPPVASIDGPFEVGFDPSSPDCRDPVWNAAVSGGTPSYSYKWFVNGAQVGTGSSYTRTVCRDDASFTLSLTVTDGASQSDSDSFTVWVVRWEM